MNEKLDLPTLLKDYEEIMEYIGSKRQAKVFAAAPTDFDEPVNESDIVLKDAKETPEKPPSVLAK